MATQAKTSASFAKVGECLYRNLSSGTYYALVKRSGKQIKKSLRTQDRKLAERRLKEFREQVGQLKATSAERKQPFSHYAERWFETYHGHLKASSAERVRHCMKGICESFGQRPIADITTRDCESWAARRGKGIAASTFNKDIEVFKAIFDYAVTAGVILSNPTQRIRRRKITNKEILIPSKAEFETLLQAVAGQDARALEAVKLLQLLAHSGMRLTEATQLTWREVDFERGSFLVTGGEFGTKSRESRVVPLFPALRDLLEQLLAETSPQPSPADRVVNIRSARTAIENACERAKLPHFTHHCLRHYFVSNAIEKGVDFKTIAAWIGHKDGGLLVAKTYGHLRDTHSYEMAKLMT
ncbi:site-specific integrase [Ruficoccus amylovorans]|uniref:Site-specific integrase n=1 Tax=Ruficoccus amylovorans TaxID=1804625 RepID=A0A842HGV3_9BACT|nr:site-specific integrase [Ruficoccus amylovorans]MBC2595410.1 site-specific integrase [Ruficoccus amylovorans]